MSQALSELYRAHSDGYRHDYQHHWQPLDIDLAVSHVVPKPPFATRAILPISVTGVDDNWAGSGATWYQEIVVDQIYPGNITFTPFYPNCLSKPSVLALDLARRQRNDSAN